MLKQSKCVSRLTDSQNFRNPNLSLGGLFYTGLNVCFYIPNIHILDFSLTKKAATLIFISGCHSAISSAKEGKSGFIYNLVSS